MQDQTVNNLLLLALGAAIGVNVLFWSVVGLLRYLSEIFLKAPDTGEPVVLADVAVVIPAHNEETALPKCLRALQAVIPLSQVYVASDGSRDLTVAIARTAGCNVDDIRPNGGKANAIAHAIRANDLCNRFKAVLILDADSEIDPGYFQHALPLLRDPKVATVAGHVLSRWPGHRWMASNLIFTAYRTRLYLLLQAAFQYGHSWKFVNVSYIAPGFASMYRTTALREIDIVAPGLVIEDFNMTFEVHRKRLGRIAYSPKVRCTSEDPARLGDYRKQVIRWYIGFWQTVWRHGFWPCRFWLALLPLLLELALLSAYLIALPFLVLAYLLAGWDSVAFSMSDLAIRQVSPVEVFLAFVAVDFALTAVTAAIERRPSLFLYAPAFPLIRILDAALFMAAFVKSFSLKSDGRWVSPERRFDGLQKEPRA
ncbi:MAG TPA: glycosyltransferase family 2 protein [Aestuariivirga sp.]